MRRRAHRDENHAEVVRDLERAHCAVEDLAAQGGGCMDLLVSYKTALGCETILVEVKNPKRYGKQRQLSEAQERFRQHWHGIIVRVESGVEAVEFIEKRRRWWRAVREAGSKPIQYMTADGITIRT